jgi:hypothetical protein
MAVSRTLLTALCLIVVAAMAPRARAQGIVACAEGQQNGNISCSSRMSSWSFVALSCFANDIKGLRSVTGFAYQLALNDDVPAQALGLIIDATASNNEIAFVNITGQQPSGSEGVVTATFASPVALDPQHTYLLAFCFTGVAAGSFVRLGAGYDVNPAMSCTQDCTSPSGTWQRLSSSSPYVLLTDIIGSCQAPSSSPSPSASQSPPPPRSPTPSPSPSPSPSPAKGSADRLTPDEARAVRFVAGLCTLLFS